VAEEGDFSERSRVNCMALRGGRERVCFWYTYFRGGLRRCRCLVAPSRRLGL
jgi:hypothetical protein